MFAKKPCLIKELSQSGNLATYFRLAARNLCVLLGACLAVSAFAQTSIKPGLWERTVTTSMGNSGMSMEGAMEQLKRTNPAAYQLAMAEMAKQGVKLTADGKMAFQECVKPEQAKRWEELIIAAIPQLEECTTITSPLVDKTQKISFTCQDANGEAKVTYQSDIAITTTVAMHACGQPTNMQISHRWLASGCGNVRNAEDCKSNDSDATSCAFQREQKRGCNQSRSSRKRK
ncbi:MAG: DUF3617 domain-containing protein [Zoogloeaceae bacterium]|nr:DUF3617 domain-containing protein [Zoogloeaceae bacterium]